MRLNKCRIEGTERAKHKFTQVAQSHQLAEPRVTRTRELKWRPCRGSWDSRSLRGVPRAGCWEMEVQEDAKEAVMALRPRPPRDSVLLILGNVRKA